MELSNEITPYLQIEPVYEDKTDNLPKVIYFTHDERPIGDLLGWICSHIQ